MTGVGRPPTKWIQARDVLIEENLGYEGPLFKKAWAKYVENHKGDLRPMPVWKKSKITPGDSGHTVTSDFDDFWTNRSAIRKTLRQLDMDENDVVSIKDAVAEDFEHLVAKASTKGSNKEHTNGWKELVIRIHNVTDHILKKFGDNEITEHTEGHTAGTKSSTPASEDKTHHNNKKRKIHIDADTGSDQDEKIDFD